MTDNLTTAQKALEKARKETDRALRASRCRQPDPVASARRVGAALLAERAAYDAWVKANREQ